MADMEIKRIALFAHYDRDGLIDDYVIYYLQGLQKVAQSILFVSNCELAAGEAAKLEGLAELVFAGKHDTYDFGSWKIGFEHIGYNLTGWDEVIIANDSVLWADYSTGRSVCEIREDGMGFLVAECCVRRQAVGSL